MGPLANLFSTIDSAKRKFGGLLENPMGTFEQLMGQMQDYRRQDQQLGDQAFGDPKKGEPLVKDRQAFAQLGQRTFDNLMSFAPAGITVWHGSPHTFSKFDSSKIGTGEGAQAYGHGLYLAESPDVARGYKDALSTTITVDGRKVLDKNKAFRTGNDVIDLNLIAANGDARKAARETLDSIRELRAMERSHPGIKEYQQDLAELRRIRPLINVENTGSLYKVDLPDEHVAKMLDWDKPLSQQSDILERVGSKLDQTRLGNELGVYRGKIPTAALSGSSIYGSKAQPASGADLYRRIVNSQWAKENPAQASAMLLEAGIPGIRYLDGGSRGAGGGTSNFVVFPGNEGLLTILERNGQPLR